MRAPLVAKYKYIAFEGIDGAGKTSQLARLARWYERRTTTPLRLFEPTFGEFGLQARQIIVAGEMRRRAELHELLTFDRKEHIKQRITPLLQFIQSHPGFVLIQDRCYLSAPAYQGTDEADTLRLLREEQSYAPRPDAIVLLRLSPEVALERSERSAGKVSPFKTKEEFAEVQARYDLVARCANENVLTVDAAGDEDEVHHRIISILELSHA